MALLIWLNLKILLLPVTSNWKINKTLVLYILVIIKTEFNYITMHFVFIFHSIVSLFIISYDTTTEGSFPNIYKLRLDKFELTILVGHFTITVLTFTTLTFFVQSPGISYNWQYHQTHTNTESMTSRFEVFKVGHSHGLETSQTGIELEK